MPDNNTDAPAIRDEILDRQIVIARGRNRQDKDFKNLPCTVNDLFSSLANIDVGPKDGVCILSGEVVGGQRLANNMKANHIIMLDIDNGMTVDGGEELIKSKGLCAVIWTTYSHMKTTTSVKEAALHQFLNKRKQVLAFELNDITGQIADYLAKEKNYTGPILNSIDMGATKREHVAGGVEYVITHNPMPRFRMLFILDEPFSFSAGLQKERIKEWKTLYSAFCNSLGVVHDSSCEDPSRLMYTPRTATADSPFDIRYIDGDFLRLSDYGPTTNAFTHNVNAPSTGDTHSRMNSDNTQTRIFMPETAGLRAFAKEAPDFDIVSCIHTLIPDSVRGPAAQGAGVCLRCPNEDAHSNVDLEDKAFYVATHEKGWSAKCLHATCKNESDDDRLWYLDRLCVEHGWTVDDLAPFSPAYQARLSATITKDNKVEAQKLTEAEFWEKVNNSTPDAKQVIDNTNADKPDSIAFACAVIARSPRIQHNIFADRLRDATGAGKADIKAIIKEQKERYEQFITASAVVDGKDSGNDDDSTPVINIPAPPNDLIYVSEIYKNWPPKVQFDSMVAILTRLNNKKDNDTGLTDPVVYRNEMGEVCSITTVDEKVYIRKLDAISLGELTLKYIPYKTVNVQTGLVSDVVPDKTLVGMMASSTDTPFPILSSISTTPIFGPDGTLQTDKGFAPSMNTYLSVKRDDWRPVSEEVSVDELREAWETILEALRDFPFSDAFDGGEMLPIKLVNTNGEYELDNDGFPLPNLDRGASSRMNAVAMILQRFARFLIPGPCPAYFIDKAEAGTGAGYLTNIVGVTLTGETAMGTVMADNDDEFRKNITSVIVEGAPYVFVDNIDRKMTSSAFAILLTSGRWKDRLLGQNVRTDIEVDNTWVLTGNNAAFTYELSRRFIPIRLDADTPDPALDRNEKDFKHYNFSAWLKENRRELVWACHTIIRAWVNGGMVGASKYRAGGVVLRDHKGDKTVHDVSYMSLNSFDAYVDIVGGIFVTSALLLNSHYPLQFMANHRPFTDNAKGETKTENDAVQDMFNMYGFEEQFTARDLFNRATDPMTNKIKNIYPVSGRDDADTTVKLGHWLGKHVTKRTFMVNTTDEKTLLVKLIKRGSKSNTKKYQFMRVQGGQ